MNDEDKKVDWERIELDYRAGVLSIREIGAARGVSHAAINKRAKKEGWERDLKARIQAKADALVSKREVSKMVTAEKVETERQLVDANAQVIADIRMAHRTDIKRARTLALSLLEEMEHQTVNLELYEELGELLRREDDRGHDKMNDLYQKVISSSGRIGSMKQLADTLKVLVTMEREAYSISGEPEVIEVKGAQGKSLDDFYEQMN